MCSGGNGLGSVRLAEDHPWASLLDKVLAYITELKRRVKAMGLPPLISSTAVENSVPVITSSLAGQKFL